VFTSFTSITSGGIDTGIINAKHSYESPVEILRERFPQVDEGVLNLPLIRFV